METSVAKLNLASPEYREDLAMRKFMSAVHEKSVNANNINKYINIYDAYRILNYFVQVEREKENIPHFEIETAEFEEINRPNTTPKRGRHLGSTSKVLSENRADVLNSTKI